MDKKSGISVNKPLTKKDIPFVTLSAYRIPAEFATELRKHIIDKELIDLSNQNSLKRYFNNQLEELIDALDMIPTARMKSKQMLSEAKFDVHLKLRKICASFPIFRSNPHLFIQFLETKSRIYNFETKYTEISKFRKQYLIQKKLLPNLEIDIQRTILSNISDSLTSLSNQHPDIDRAMQELSQNQIIIIEDLMKNKLRCATAFNPELEYYKLSYQKNNFVFSIVVNNPNVWDPYIYVQTFTAIQIYIDGIEDTPFSVFDRQIRNYVTLQGLPTPCPDFILGLGIPKDNIFNCEIKEIKSKNHPPAKFLDIEKIKEFGRKNPMLLFAIDQMAATNLPFAQALLQILDSDKQQK